MKIVGAMVVGKDEGERWLKPCLEQFNILDGALIAQNNVDAKTKLVIEESGFNTYEDNREWGICQNKIKESLAKNLDIFKPDWVVSLDADEFLEKQLTREKLEELASQSYDIAYYFWCVEFWDSADQYREDFTFDDVRFWKYLPNLLSFRNTPVHCGMAPEWNYRWGTHSGYFFKHYGLLKREDRLKKVERYEKYDNKGIYLPKQWYESLKDANPPLKHFDEEEFIKILPETKFRKRQIMGPGIEQPKKYWRFINPYGVLITFDKEVHYRQRIKDPKWKFLGDDTLQSLRREEVPFTPEGMPCEQCSFAGKSELSLKIHKSRMHK